MSDESRANDADALEDILRQLASLRQDGSREGRGPWRALAQRPTRERILISSKE
jgi:hypothetical protein